MPNEKRQKMTIETIDNISSNIETIPAMSFIEDMTPWLSVDRLDPSISIRWEQSAPTPPPTPTSQVGLLIFQVTTFQGVWLHSFTWFWFMPTSYSIRMCGDWFNSEILQSEWAYQSNGTRYSRWIQWVGSNRAWPNGSAFVARVINNAWNLRTAVNHSSFLPDWIELSFQNLDYSVILEITAYQ